MRNEIEAGRAAMPDRDAEISQKAARAMLAALRALYDRDTPDNRAAARAAIALAERGA